MQKLNIMTYNVRGLQNKNKRIKIFNYIKERNASGICLLQETHSDENVYKSWQIDWGQSESFFNHGSSNARGTAILLSPECMCKVLKYEHDSTGRLQLISIEHDAIKYLIVNIYNPNSESDQVPFLQKVNDALKHFTDISEHNIIMGGDFNMYYDLKLDIVGGNPSLKAKRIAEIIKMKEAYDLCDIFRVRHPNTRRYTYRSKNPKLSRRLDHFLITDSLQQSVDKIVFLPTIEKCDHSPLLLKVDFLKENETGKGYWKFNNSLLQNDAFCLEINQTIESVLRENNDIDDMIKWELLKYEVRNVSIRFSKNLAKQKRENIRKLEHIVTDFESKSEKYSCFTEKQFEDAKDELDKIIQEKTRGFILRSKCQWYEEGEKSTKFFLNLEKTRAKKSTIRKLIVEDSNELNTTKEVIKNNEILKEIKQFYK